MMPLAELGFGVVEDNGLFRIEWKSEFNHSEPNIIVNITEIVSNVMRIAYMKVCEKIKILDRIEKVTI